MASLNMRCSFAGGIRCIRRSRVFPENPPHLCRCFSLDQVLSSNASREARFMMKIMGKHKSKTKMYFFDHVDSSPASPSAPRPYNRRRMSVLNKLFMKNITEVLATGSTSNTIEGLGIEICKVSMAPDFKIINVLYVSKKKPRPADLEETLTDAGYTLRHELSQLRLMGEVPRVIFVEDKTLSRLDEIQEILAAADKGSDEPNQETEEEVMVDEEEKVEMYNDSQRAYGLNHSRILEKIVSAKKASSPNKRKQDRATVLEGIPYSPSAVSNPPTIKGRGETPKRLVASFLKENKSSWK